MKKVLVASGCSFTFEDWNWPTFVAEELDYDLINVGMASQGNGLISKKAIYQVNKLLKTKDPEDILVGIMWSGIDRDEFYVRNYPYVKGKGSPGNVDGWIENPTNILEGEEHRNWLITNISWKIPMATLWYKHFHTDIGALIQTLENVLRTQWYLEKYNIKYFMTTFLNIFENEWVKNYMEHPEVSYLYDMVNKDTFLDVDGCYEWVKNNCDLSRAFPDGKPDDRMGIHPTEYGHRKFTEHVIIPHIKEKNNVNN
jgi:hypothetical protein